jgi:hypothetical protein
MELVSGTHGHSRLTPPTAFAGWIRFGPCGSAIDARDTERLLPGEALADVAAIRPNDRTRVPLADTTRGSRKRHSGSPCGGRQNFFGDEIPQHGIVQRPPGQEPLRPTVLILECRDHLASDTSSPPYLTFQCYTKTR